MLPTIMSNHVKVAAVVAFYMSSALVVSILIIETLQSGKLTVLVDGFCVGPNPFVLDIE